MCPCRRSEGGSTASDPGPPSLSSMRLGDASAHGPGDQGDAAVTSRLDLAAQKAALASFVERDPLGGRRESSPQTSVAIPVHKDSPQGPGTPAQVCP